MPLILILSSKYDGRNCCNAYVNRHELYFTCIAKNNEGIDSYN